MKPPLSEQLAAARSSLEEQLRAKGQRLDREQINVDGEAERMAQEIERLRAEVDGWQLAARFERDARHEQKASADAAEAEVARLRTVLSELVTLKRIKEHQGATPDYLDRKERAWAVAFHLEDERVRAALEPGR